MKSGEKNICYFPSLNFLFFFSVFLSFHCIYITLRGFAPLLPFFCLRRGGFKLANTGTRHHRTSLDITQSWCPTRPALWISADLCFLGFFFFLEYWRLEVWRVGASRSSRRKEPCLTSQHSCLLPSGISLEKENWNSGAVFFFFPEKIMKICDLCFWAGRQEGWWGRAVGAMLQTGWHFVWVCMAHCFRCSGESSDVWCVAS